MKQFFLFIFLSLSLAVSTQGAESIEYRNPIAPPLEGEWEDYGFGDPFVMRFNGRYYLHPSTRDDQIGVKVWSSKDLVSWRYEGLCTTDPTSKGAYAPEVCRLNDAFYMVASPAGQGHYVYRSESPTGSFERITENLGFSIDGSVFTDDDGKVYFYHASDAGILAREMIAPDKFDARSTNINAFMNGWTEGPTVFKVDGVYYATYTGNHVFSRGYRIDAGVGKSPLKFRPNYDNPILVSTERNLYGLGHNSVVKSPNLDLYYVVYHSLVGRGKKQGWPLRETNIDRLVLNCDQVAVVGPTRSTQRIDLPDQALWFESNEDLKKLEKILASFLDASKTNADSPTIQGGLLRLEKNSAVVLREKLTGDFTAEFNLKLDDATNRAGALFCYKDAQNYGRVLISPQENEIALISVVDGKEAIKRVAVPKIFDKSLSFLTLRSLQIERTNDRFSFYVDDRLFAEINAPLPDGSVGYFTENGAASFGFLGATSATQGRSAARLVENAPGIIPACYRTTREGQKSVDVQEQLGARRRLLPIKEGDALDLEIDVAKEGFYDVAITSQGANKSVATLTVGSASPVKIALEASETPRSTIRRKIAFSAGTTRLSFGCVQGGVELDEIEIRPNMENAALQDFESFRDAPEYSDGTWQVRDGALIASDDAPYGKRLYGAPALGDYRIKATISFPDERADGSILIRAQNPALGGANNSPRLGIDFFQGYCLSFERNKIKLERRSYEQVEILAEAPFQVKPNEPIKLQIEAKGNALEITVDEKKTLNWIDAKPFYWGSAGFRACGSPLKIEDFRIESTILDE